MRNNRSKRLYGAVVGVAAVALAAGGCGGSGNGSGSGGRKGSASPTPLRVPSGGKAVGAPLGVTAAAWHKWGLKPLPATPKPPADKPVKLSAHGPVPVFSHIPTSQKVVFITVDDGQEKDPRFIAMMRDLKIPITMFLMNDAIKSDYGYFKSLQSMGDHIQNHTLHHPAMNTVPLARQKEEVCGDQKILTRRYGTAPLLFRPPYGAYDAGTKTAVGECGPRAIVWWRESMQITNMQYQTADKKLRPGDIILAHFRGPSELKGTTMTKMFANLLERIREQGFAVARLEDYIQPPAR
ncbi:polysaccharide deacetylase family protein [Streptomyces sp. Li-HN-5-11]|uniref:polysaccharide deacetylase family protein n=1 Tax=Streptomyces sp. Li-HN-5-11 TaxID=3075432 RepID=UPI0028B02B17|nr:polysaccharide deacetylase family protein [Streptomyces sp. Li-HN-5-11]WNM34652.1 polysaccharide deacetylase family protein [Streptomyces sp. Li-HN-5-11]